MSEHSFTDSHLPPVIQWQNERLTLLDQTQLPHEVVLEEQQSVEQVWESIRQLKVRGAPAIGVAAAYGLCVAMQPFRSEPVERFLSALREKADYLDSSRPTAINLHWALQRMLAAAGSDSTEAIYQRLVSEAEAIDREDRELCHQIGVAGVELIQPGMGVLTHCNAGALATAGIGTATAPLYLAHQRGVKFQVYSGETRPLLQGARLTAWELQRAGLDVQLITDSMAAHIMAGGHIQMVIVGTDRVAANGDVANKIGTHGLAILAKHFGIPFYVACPYSTIDLNTATGAEIPIEEREPHEVKGFAGAQAAAESIKVRNPAFDVTPHELVTGIITERGIVTPPFAGRLHAGRETGDA